MINVENKISATTLYFPVNIDKNEGNSYVLTLKTESYENTFTKSIEDEGDSTKYITATVQFSDVPDGEYGYTVTYGSTVYSDGLICIGDYDNGDVVYDLDATFYEYDPESGEGTVVNPLNLASIITAFTANSGYSISTPQGYQGIKDVTVSVNVSGGTEINNQTKSISISANGQTEVTYDSGYTGLEKVNINVNVPTSLLQTKDVTLSETAVTITPDTGYDGMSEVFVDAKGVYDNGYADAQDAMVATAITANGSYSRVEGYSDITVNVPQTGSTDKLVSVLNKTVTELTTNDLSGLTSVGDYAFYNCSRLTSLSIPDSVTSIGVSSLYDCSSLTALTIGNSVQTIGNNAFELVALLSSLDIPSSVTSIGNYAFFDCLSLASLTCRATTPPSLGSGALRNTPIASGTGYIYVPSSSVSAYQGATNWSQYASQIRAIPE